VTLSDFIYFNLTIFLLDGQTDGHTHTHTHTMYMTEELCVVSKKCICEFQISII